MDRKKLANILVTHILHPGKSIEELIDTAQLLLDKVYQEGYEDGKRDIVRALRDETKKVQPQ